jgi:hypothetical protein
MKLNEQLVLLVDTSVQRSVTATSRFGAVGEADADPRALPGKRRS